MVGIVIISQSKKLAEGVKEIADRVANNKVRIDAAGGVDNGLNGTESIRIMEAILTAESGDGVVVLCDLGGTVISAQAAINMLDDDRKKSIIIADAPILEGAVGAALEASEGAALEDVVAAAEEAYELQKF
jgi:dihydroxyacetone kinase phosphotransfer subunit